MGLGEITHECLERERTQRKTNIKEIFQREGGSQTRLRKDRQAGEPGEVSESKEELTFIWYLLLTFVMKTDRKFIRGKHTCENTSIH